MLQCAAPAFKLKLDRSPKQSWGRGGRGKGGDSMWHIRVAASFLFMRKELLLPVPASGQQSSFT